MDDLIKRQDAIDSIQPWIDGYGYNETERNIMRCCIQVIKDVPSAQKTGKWITKSNIKPYYTIWWYECSECGQRPLQDGYGQEAFSDYCPNCGARMVGEEE